MNNGNAVERSSCSLIFGVLSHIWFKRLRKIKKSCQGSLLSVNDLILGATECKVECYSSATFGAEIRGV